MAYSTKLSIHDEDRGVDIEETHLSFEGEGRWLYDTNLNNMHNWLVEELDDKMLKVYHELLDYMKNTHKVIMVEYIDDEFGCEVLCEVEGVLKAYASDDGVALEYESCSRENYDYTRSNLVALELYDAFECMADDVISELTTQGYDITAKTLDDINAHLETNPFIEVDNAVAATISTIDGQADKTLTKTLTVYVPITTKYVALDNETVSKRIRQQIGFDLE